MVDSSGRPVGVSSKSTSDPRASKASSVGARKVKGPSFARSSSRSVASSAALRVVRSPSSAMIPATVPSNSTSCSSADSEACSTRVEAFVDAAASSGDSAAPLCSVALVPFFSAASTLAMACSRAFSRSARASPGGMRTLSILWTTPLSANRSASTTSAPVLTMSAPSSSLMMTGIWMKVCALMALVSFRASTSTSDVALAGMMWYLRMVDSSGRPVGVSSKSTSDPRASKASSVGARKVKGPSFARSSSRSVASSAALRVVRSPSSAMIPATVPSNSTSSSSADSEACSTRVEAFVDAAASSGDSAAPLCSVALVPFFSAASTLAMACSRAFSRSARASPGGMRTLSILWTTPLSANRSASTTSAPVLTMSAPSSSLMMTGIWMKVCALMALVSFRASTSTSDVALAGMMWYLRMVDSSGRPTGVSSKSTSGPRVLKAASVGARMV
mmetsp:Transcript_18568/g.44728  ORF Transcript_18568/g.44728 Transcript_18568/m.44728 type:complete len:447 (+) Transcript_18568:1-1341(+)